MPDAPCCELLSGQRVLVTGASRGIGAAAARVFAANGADLILVARSSGPLDVVASELGQTGREVVALTEDITAPEGLEAVAGAVADAPVNVLVNNAFPSSELVAAPDVLRISADAWRSAFEACVIGPHRLVGAVVPGMQALGGGSIINVTTSSVPVAGFASAGVAKAGLWALTQYLSVELAPTIRVNAVCPGTIGADDQTRAHDRSDLLEDVPLARRGTPAEVAAAMLYLASDASSYTTGAVLPVTGGRRT